MECWRSPSTTARDAPWVSVLKSLFDAGFFLEATYPIRSDETKGEGASPEHSVRNRLSTTSFMFVESALRTPSLSAGEVCGAKCWQTCVNSKVCSKIMRVRGFQQPTSK